MDLIKTEHSENKGVGKLDKVLLYLLKFKMSIYILLPKPINQIFIPKNLFYDYTIIKMS